MIVYESDDEPTRGFLDAVRLDPSLSLREVSGMPKRTLGELRNLSIESARGEYFCQWDDDDWYHADRLRNQVTLARSLGQTAVLLTNWLIFDATESRVYLSSFRLWEGSILCRKDIVGPEAQYPAMNRMEDSYFVNAMMRRGSAYPLVSPALYIYELHKGNTWNDAQARRLLSRSQRLSDDASHLVAAILNGDYSPAEGSKLLDSSGIQKEFNYLYSSKLMLSDENLKKYGLLMSMNLGRATAAGPSAANRDVPSGPA